MGEQIPGEKEQLEASAQPLAGDMLEQEWVQKMSTPVAPEPAAYTEPKKRGRPPEAHAGAPPVPKAKAAPNSKNTKPEPPTEESPNSSDDDDTLRTVNNHVAKPDMGTMKSRMRI